MIVVLYGKTIIFLQLRSLPCSLVGQTNVFDKVFSHFCSSCFSPLVPIVLELRVVSRLGKDLDQFGLETQQVLWVVDTRNFRSAVHLVHSVANLVIPEEKHLHIFIVKSNLKKLYNNLFRFNIIVIFMVC